MLIEEPIAEQDRPEQARRMMDLGDCLAAAGELEQAKGWYLKAARLAPQMAGPNLALGMLALRGDDLATAQQHLSLASTQDPRCADAHAGLAMIHHRRRQYDFAFRRYMQCLELDSDNLVALLGLFQTSCQMGTFANIIRYLQLYLENHPSDASVLFCLATLYARGGQFAAARQTVERVLELEPLKEQAIALLQQIDAKLTCEEA